jgi:hypothetical protein
MSMTYQDYFITGVVSECCLAPMVITDMCSECYEHCGPADLEEWSLYEEDDDEM